MATYWQIYMLMILNGLQQILAERGGFEPSIFCHLLRLLESSRCGAESTTCKTLFPVTLAYDNLRQPLLTRF